MNNIFRYLLLAFNFGLLIPFFLFLVSLPTAWNKAPISSICQYLSALSLPHILIAVWSFLFQSSFVFIVSFCEVLGSSMGVLGFTLKFHMVSIKAALLINSPKSESPVSLELRMDIHNVVYSRYMLRFHCCSE